MYQTFELSEGAKDGLSKKTLDRIYSFPDSEWVNEHFNNRITTSEMVELGFVSSYKEIKRINSKYRLNGTKIHYPNRKKYSDNYHYYYKKSDVLYFLNQVEDFIDAYEDYHSEVPLSKKPSYQTHMEKIQSIDVPNPHENILISLKSLKKLLKNI